MRILILLITSSVLLISCSTHTKEKELPSYFCNENLERYFAGNDSLPIININPNDSFGVIRERVDSLYKKADKDNTNASFRIPVKLDSSTNIVYLEVRLLDYFPSGQTPIICRNKRSILQILMTTNNKLIIKKKLNGENSVSEFVSNFITNNGRYPYYSDSPHLAVVSLQKDTSINSTFYNKTIKSIIEGYSKALDIESKSKYNKSFCKLSQKENNIISQRIPFNFYLEYPETIQTYINLPLIPQPKNSLSDFPE